MEVSSIEKINSHVLIGGKHKARKQASISNSAEFFTVLSSTLYGDKLRAAIREPLCNAWDAHVMAGTPNRPIEISLSEDTLRIRDYGPGISDAQIEEIYLTYGASTKVKQKNQTGGFGLGSKAPWAYTDHFTVTSDHAGVRNVYTASKGGVDTGDRPAMIPLVSVPTDQQGVEIAIPLKDRDHDKARKIIEELVASSGHPALLNGELMLTFDLQKARKNGFVMCRAKAIGCYGHTIYLHQGSVIYPIDAKHSDQVRALEKANSAENHSLVLIAEPDTVGIQPSREQLSYTDLTIKTIGELAEKARKKLKAQSHAIRKEALYDEAIVRFQRAGLNQIAESLEKESENLIQEDDGTLEKEAFVYSAAAAAKLFLHRGAVNQNALANLIYKRSRDFRKYGPALFGYKSHGPLRIKQALFNKQFFLLQRILRRHKCEHKLEILTRPSYHLPIERLKYNTLREIHEPRSQASNEILISKTVTGAKEAIQNRNNRSEFTRFFLLFSPKEHQLQQAVLKEISKYPEHFSTKVVPDKPKAVPKKPATEYPTISGKHTTTPSSVIYCGNRIFTAEYRNELYDIKMISKELFDNVALVSNRAAFKNKKTRPEFFDMALDRLDKLSKLQGYQLGLTFYREFFHSYYTRDDDLKTLVSKNFELVSDIFGITPKRVEISKEVCGLLRVLKIFNDFLSPKQTERFVDITSRSEPLPQYNKRALSVFSWTLFSQDQAEIRAILKAAQKIFK